MRKFVSVIIVMLVICVSLQSVGLTASAGAFDFQKKGEMRDSSSEDNQPIYWVLDYNTFSGEASLKLSGNGYMPNGTDDSWLLDLARSGCVLTEVTIDEGVKSIMSGAFSGQAYLTEISLPESLEFIGEAAFDGTGIKKVHLPSRLEEFDGTIFSNGSVTEYTVSEDNPKYKAVDGVVYSKDGTVLVAYPSGRFIENGDLIPKIPKTVTSIGKYAFLNCGEKAIRIPSNVKSIGMQAFAGNTNLKNLVIENGLEYIYDGAFLACKSLSKVRLPRSVKYIGYCSIGFKYKIDFEAIEAILDSEGIEHDEVNEDNVLLYLAVEPLSNYYNIDSFVVCYADENVKIYAPKGSAGHEYTKIFGVGYVQSEALEPKLVSISLDNDAVKLSWAESGDADGYNVYRKNTEGKWKLIKEISGKSKTSYTDKAPVSGFENTYTVRAVSSSGKSSFDKKGLSVYYLKTPTLKSLKAASGGLKLSWSSVKSAENYNVYRKSAANDSWEHIAVVKGSKSSYTDKNVNHNVKYTYTVKAWNSEGASSYDSEGLRKSYVIAPEVTSLSNAASGVKIKWSSVESATAYRVYRRVCGGSWQMLGDVGGSVNAFTDKTAQSGIAYEYTVKAFIGAKSSACVTSDKITFLSTPKMKSAQSTKNGIIVNFGKVSGAGGYLIYRKTSSDGEWERVGKINVNSFVDKTAKKGTTYYYTVKAYSGSEKSSFDKKGIEIKDKY